ncbi:hypothetical protein BDZ85DRAFT_247947 [Elsinoe ampelina]|uniref:Uncharacterized protein n=1 Tax=Elsinoe ampelina TaxID=302913 RepID=A0A6A6GJW7_9PEZI|nr:hypothetical protein BDZ85DRAFT_247947 [Elsinoe ampelina]
MVVKVYISIRSGHQDSRRVSSIATGSSQQLPQPIQRSTDHHLVQSTDIRLGRADLSVSETAVDSRTSTIPDNGSVRDDNLPELFVTDTTTSLTHEPAFTEPAHTDHGFCDAISDTSLVSDVSCAASLAKRGVQRRRRGCQARMAENVSIRTTSPAGGSSDTTWLVAFH